MAKTPVSDENLKLFIKLFKTSDVSYAVQVYYKDRGVQWFRKEKDVNFEADARKHLAGTETIGSYAIHLDGDDRDFCSWCVLDFDIPKKVCNYIESLDEDAREEAYAKELRGIRQTIKTLLISLPQIGMTAHQALVEFSGNKGYHVWFFFEEPVPARSAYLFLNGIKAYFNLPPELEAFPKQISAGDAYGNLIKLPLGIHKKTGNRCLFTNILQDDADVTLGSQFDMLKNVEKINTKLMDEVINKSSIELPNHIKNAGMSGGEELVDLTKNPFNADIKEISKKCIAIARLEKKAKQEHHLIHNERLALQSFYIQFGETGKKRLHSIMKHCSDYDEKVTEDMLQQAIRKCYKPISCARLQEWHICKENCQNILRAGGTSPIKFAYKITKTDLSLTYIEEMETQQCVGKTVKFPFKVTSLIQSGASYAVDKEIEFICPRTCPERYAEKPKCTYALEVGRSSDKKSVVKIKPDDPYILMSVGNSVQRMLKMAASRSKIPCPKINNMKINVKSHHHVSQILIASSDQVMRERLFETKTSMESKNYVAYYVGPGGIQTGKEYMGFGKILQHPDDHKLTFVITKIEPLLGNLNDFVPTEEDKDRLMAFRDIPPAVRLTSIAQQAVMVKDRNMEVLCALLTFFSPLQIRFNGRMLKRGWIETCFIGDSSQGKSHIPEGLMKFAGFYNQIAGSQATEAGVIGGVSSIDKKHYISWGMLPRCDKTLVFIDEMEKLQQKTGTLTALREVRSTGIATITKIVHGSRLARVRLITSANTKKHTSINDYRRGCQSLMEIMEGPDVRRFDIICFFYPNTVDAKQVFSKVTKEKCIIDPEDFQLALRFVWTRSAEEIIIDDAATEAILEKSYDLYEKYKGAAQTVPIISLDVYEKIARIASASACWRLNTTDFKTIQVTPEDAEIAFQLLDGIYSSREVALHEEAKDCIMRNEVGADWLQKFKRKVQSSSITQEVNMEQALIHLNSIDKTRSDDLAFYLSVKRSTAVTLLQFLTIERLVEAELAGYYKPTSKLYKLVRAIGNGDIKLNEEDEEQQISIAI